MSVGHGNALKTAEPPEQVPLICIASDFLRLGVTAFGGPAMVAYIRELAVVRRGWLDGKSFGRGVAMCQTIPGATAMQVAAYVGLRLRGLAGACAAYLGFGLPAFLLMLMLSALYQLGHDLPVAESLFHGLRAAVVALVANAAVNFGRTSLKAAGEWVVAGLAAVALSTGASPVLVVLGAALAGCLLLRGEPSGAPEPDASGRSLLRDTGWLLAASGVALGLLFVADRQLFALAVTMLRIDLFAFGGGFASVPLMQHEFVAVRHWMDERTFMDGIAMGQVTPGPIVITATFVGFWLRGVAGAAVATAGIFVPSLAVLCLVLPMFDRLERAPLFGGAMRGALVAFVGLLVWVTIQFGLQLAWSVPASLLAVACLIALRRGVDILWVVLGAAMLSILFM